jgi:hypothetical protein
LTRIKALIENKKFDELEKIMEEKNKRNATMIPIEIVA